MLYCPGSNYIENDEFGPLKQCVLEILRTFVYDTVLSIIVRNSNDVYFNL